MEREPLPRTLTSGRYLPHVRVAPPLGKTLPRACSALVFAAVAAVLVISCASSKQGLQREQAFHDAVTNGVSSYVQPVVALLPQPWNGVAEGLLAAAVAGLGLWTRSLHRRTAALDAVSGALPAAPNPSPAQQTQTSSTLHTTA